jgi:hypothetical protein
MIDSFQSGIATWRNSDVDVDARAPTAVALSNTLLILNVNTNQRLGQENIALKVI